MITVHIPNAKNKTNLIRDETKKTEPSKEVKNDSNLEGNYIGINYLEIPEVLLIAVNIFNGRYGNGEERINNLKGLGYSDKDIEAIQKWVNIISPLYDN